MFDPTERKVIALKTIESTRAILNIDNIFEWILWMASFFCLEIMFMISSGTTQRISDLRSGNDWPKNNLILI